MSGNQDTAMNSVNSALKAMIQRKGFTDCKRPHRFLLIFKVSLELKMTYAFVDE